MSDDFPAFALSEEHEALREAVRALADDKIAPRAADIDRTSEFPWDVYEALVKADFQAVHIPEAYGGAGADAIATAIVIEEVARACASSSLIPAVNKLGTVPLMLAASEDVKARYLAPVARGEAMFSYALSEPEAGSDAAAMKTRAVPADSGYVLNGVKRWITNAGVSKYYTVMAVTDPPAGANGISAFVLEDGDPGFTFGALKNGTGLLLDMGRTVTVSSVRLSLVSRSGAGIALRAGSKPVPAWLPQVATAANAGGTVQLRPAAPVQVRYVLIWFTKLPPDNAGHYQAAVYRITVQGHR